MAVLTGTGNYVELPFELAGCLVISQDIPRYVLDSRLQITLLSGVAHDDSVVNYNRWRGSRDVASL